MNARGLRRGAGSIAGVALAALACAALPVRAQMPPPPQNVVSLSAAASAELPMDWLTVSFGTARDGSDAAAVQAQLRQALEGLQSRSGDVEAVMWEEVPARTARRPRPCLAPIAVCRGWPTDRCRCVVDRVCHAAASCGCQ